MARQDRGYGRDFGDRRPPPSGGMRSDGWQGNEDWRNFAGEEGWYGHGYEGMPGAGYDAAYGGGDRGRNSWGRDYGGDFRGRGGSFGGGWDRGRDAGFSEGWEDDRSGRRQGSGRGEGGRIRAAEIMTENPETVTPDTTLSDVAQKMRDLDVGIIPVIDGKENRRIRGVITDRDIAVRAIAEGKDGTAKVSECMTKDVRTVNKNDSIQDVMRVMREEQLRRVAVTDREGRLVGIIAQADLMLEYAGEDDERELEVENVIERISMPGDAQRGGNRMAARGRYDR